MLTDVTRAQMRIDVWNTICSQKPNSNLLHMRLMAPGKSREDLINRGNKCMAESFTVELKIAIKEHE